VRRHVVAGNWKMHGSRDWIGQWIQDWLPQLDTPAELMVLPPAAYLGLVATELTGKAVVVGAQNVHAEAAGAYTGEISAEMVRDLGGQAVLVGHSERRGHFGETDEIVAAKVVAARRAGLRPVVCVGESLEARRRGDAERVVLGQVEAVARLAGWRALDNAMIAYEPVWAIGTGETATPSDAQQMHAVIRGWIAREVPDLAARIPILYGGSVKASNAAALFAEPDVDGGLVGGASLDAREFALICNAV